MYGIQGDVCRGFDSIQFGDLSNIEFSIIFK